MEPDDVKYSSKVVFGRPRWGSSPDGLTSYTGPIHVVLTVKDGALPSMAAPKTLPVVRQVENRLSFAHVTFIALHFGFALAVRILVTEAVSEIPGASGRVAAYAGMTCGVIVWMVGSYLLLRRFDRQQQIVAANK